METDCSDPEARLKAHEGGRRQRVYKLQKILKQVGIKWSPIYLRRCLDERYKDPVNRMNALVRKRYPGVPGDTGKSVEVAGKVT